MTSRATRAGPGEEVQVRPYVIISDIGKGSFATVYKGYHESTSHPVAIKSIPRSILTTKLLENLHSEIHILKSLSHRHITRLLDIIKGETHIFLIMEYCIGGDLTGYIKLRGRVPGLEFREPGGGEVRFWTHPRIGGLDEVVVRSFLRQLARALKFLRHRNLIHRDIKPQNLLLHPASSDELSKGHPLGVPILKIADFGFARSLPNAMLAETLCGSPLYMAPEILRYEKYDAKADLWSVGAVLYEMSVGRPPFRAQNHIELLRRIEGREVKFPEDEPSSHHHQAYGARGTTSTSTNTNTNTTPVPEDIKTLIKSLLKRNPVERASFEEFFDSEALRNSKVPLVRRGGVSSSIASSSSIGGSIGGTSVVGAPMATRAPPPPVPVGSTQAQAQTQTKFRLEKEKEREKEREKEKEKAIPPEVLDPKALIPPPMFHFRRSGSAVGVGADDRVKGEEGVVGDDLRVVPAPGPAIAGPRRGEGGEILERRGGGGGGVLRGEGEREGEREDGSPSSSSSIALIPGETEEDGLLRREYVLVGEGRVLEVGRVLDEISAEPRTRPHSSSRAQSRPLQQAPAPAQAQTQTQASARPQAQPQVPSQSPTARTIPTRFRRPLLPGNGDGDGDGDYSAPATPLNGSPLTMPGLGVDAHGTPATTPTTTTSPVTITSPIPIPIPIPIPNTFPPPPNPNPNPNPNAITIIPPPPSIRPTLSSSPGSIASRAASNALNRALSLASRKLFGGGGGSPGAGVGAGTAGNLVEDGGRVRSGNGNITAADAEAEKARGRGRGEVGEGGEAGELGGREEGEGGEGEVEGEEEEEEETDPLEDALLFDLEQLAQKTEVLTKWADEMYEYVKAVPQKPLPSPSQFTPHPNEAPSKAKKRQLRGLEAEYNAVTCVAVYLLLMEFSMRGIEMMGRWVEHLRMRFPEEGGVGDDTPRMEMEDSPPQRPQRPRPRRTRTSPGFTHALTYFKTHFEKCNSRAGLVKTWLPVKYDGPRSWIDQLIYDRALGLSRTAARKELLNTANTPDECEKLYSESLWCLYALQDDLVQKGNPFGEEDRETIGVWITRTKLRLVRCRERMLMDEKERLEDARADPNLADVARVPPPWEAGGGVGGGGGK